MQIVTTLSGERAFENAALRMTRRAALLPATLYAAQHRLATDIRRFVTIALRGEAPKKTGALASGIGSDLFRAGDGLIIAFASDQAYARYVVEGTAPHEIVATNARALAFEVNGQMVFARSVHHPGTAPNDFPGRALARSEPAISAALALAGREILVSFVRT